MRAAILSLDQVSTARGAEAIARHIPDRYEMKFLISEEDVPLVRGAIEPFCSLDRHSADSPARQYTIQSLYLDTDRRDLYRITRENLAERWKARVRFYGRKADATDTVYLEVKKKRNGMIRKPRVRVRAADWVDIVRNPHGAAAAPMLALFRDKVLRHNLQPTLLVRYQREAWVSAVDAYARVTFDRRLESRPWTRWDLDIDGDEWLPFDQTTTMKGVPRAVVVEMKCAYDVPSWMSRTATLLGLTRTGFSKYCNGVESFWGQRALQGYLDDDIRS